MPCVDSGGFGKRQLCPACVSEFFADGTCEVIVPNFGATLTGTWVYEDGVLITTYSETGGSDKWSLVNNNGALCLYRKAYNEGLDSRYYYRLSDYQKDFDKIFVTVDIAQVEDLRDYIGFYTCEYEIYDAWDEPTGEKYERAEYAVRKLEGLYYWGSSENLQFEVNIPEYTYYYNDGEDHYTDGAYTQLNASYDRIVLTLRHTHPDGDSWIDLDLDDITFGRARGTLTYIREEYVKEFRTQEDHRVIVAEIDGKTYEYWTAYYGYDC